MIDHPSQISTKFKGVVTENEEGDQNLLLNPSQNNSRYLKSQHFMIRLNQWLRLSHDSHLRMSSIGYVQNRKGDCYFGTTQNRNSDCYCGTDGVFYNISMRAWRFRYVYWKSSQSYVFTEGWNTFVKVNNFEAKDKVVFFSCDQGRMIKVVYHDEGENRNNEVENQDPEKREMKNDMVDNVESRGSNKGEMGKLSNVAGGPSDSIMTDYPPQAITKFKGVVAQPRGRWGAQIYTTKQRIWLGTFKSENEAAMAYDSAAIKICSDESCRNFPWNCATAHLFSTKMVLNMIKDGSYSVKFSEYLKAQFQAGNINAIENFDVPTIVNGGYLCRQLFQKELTPSDVGSLNRLVIPKKNALEYFPHITENEESEQHLLFHDTSMRSWSFRYVYWKSSQSYVFTKGWNTFVKANQLKANDKVMFFPCGGARVIKVVYHDQGENRNN